MSKYLLHGSLTGKPKCQKNLAKILLEASKPVLTAKGCQLYAVSIDPRDQNNVWITEIWTTKEDHDNSLSVTGVKELIAQAMPLLPSPPIKGQELEILFKRI